MSKGAKPVCAICKRRIEWGWDVNRWRHLLTVAGKEAETDHRGTLGGIGK